MPQIKIPDATIAFSSTARVPPMSVLDPKLLDTLTRRMIDQHGTIAENCMLEIRPSGHFVTYGVGVSLMDMRDPKSAGSRACRLNRRVV